MWKQKIQKIALFLIIIFVAVALFVYMKSTKQDQPPVEIKEKVWLVNTLEAKFEALAPTQRLYGQVESSSMVAAAAPVTGVVERVWVKEGEEVQAGAPLVAMSREDLVIPLRQARADVVEARSQLSLEKLAYQANQEKLAHEQKVLEFKRSDVERTKELLKKDLTSLSVLEQVKEALARQEYVVVGAQLAVEEHKLKTEQYKARLQKAQAALAQAELNLTRGEVLAPYDGRVAKVHVSAGERINAGTVMVEYYDLNSLELRAKLPVREFGRIHGRLRAGEPVKAIYQGGEAAESVELRVLRLAGTASASGVDLFMALPEALRFVRPGDLLEVDLEGRHFEKVVAVPYSALYGSRRLYLVEEGRLKAVEAKVLGDKMVDGSLWALVEPVFPEGSRICTTHLPNAVSGLKVSQASEVSP